MGSKKKKKKNSQGVGSHGFVKKLQYLNQLLSYVYIV